MTGGNKEDDQLNRRRVLQAMAVASTTGLAGCSVSTPFGELSASGDGGSTPTDPPTTAPTDTPTPVTAVRETSTPTTAPTGTMTTPEEVEFDPDTLEFAANSSRNLNLDSVPQITPAGGESNDSDSLNLVTPVQVDDSIDPETVRINQSVNLNETIEIDAGDGESDGGVELTRKEPESEDDSFDPDDYETEEATKLDQKIGDPSKIEVDGQVEVTVTPETNKEASFAVGSTRTTETSEMVCTVRRRKVTAGGGRNLLLNPELGTIWPGAILPAKSIAEGKFSPALSPDRRNDRPVSEIRSPLRLSVSLKDVQGKNSRRMDLPTKSSYRTQLDSLLTAYDNDVSIPARMSYDISQIHSSEQLDVALGAHYNSPGVSVENQFDFSSQSETNKLLVNFYQEYYDAGIDLPNPLADGLVSNRDRFLRANDVIVNQVTYGRILLFSAESNYQRTKVENALDVAFSGVQSGNVSLDVSDERVLRETNIKGTVIGGSAQNAARTVSKPGEGALRSIQNFIEDGATYNPNTSPGAPIGYMTKYVSNYNTANTYLTTSYNERSCQPKTRKYRVHNVKWLIREVNDPGRDEDVYGLIGVVGFGAYRTPQGLQYQKVFPDGQNNTLVWKRERNEYKSLQARQRWNTGVDVTITFPEAENMVREKSFVGIAGRPFEADDFSNEEWTNWQKSRWFLTDAPSDPDRAGQGIGQFKDLRWRDHQEEIWLSYDISTIPP